jgi:hypothetical protein
MYPFMIMFMPTNNATNVCTHLAHLYMEIVRRLCLKHDDYFHFFVHTWCWCLQRLGIGIHFLPVITKGLIWWSSLFCLSNSLFVALLTILFITFACVPFTALLIFATCFLCNFFVYQVIVFLVSFLFSTTLFHTFFIATIIWLSLQFHIHFYFKWNLHLISSFIVNILPSFYNFPYNSILLFVRLLILYSLVFCESIFIYKSHF